MGDFALENTPRFVNCSEVFMTDSDVENMNNNRVRNRRSSDPDQESELKNSKMKRKYQKKSSYINNRIKREYQNDQYHHNMSSRNEDGGEGDDGDFAFENTPRFVNCTF